MCPHSVPTNMYMYDTRMYMHVHACMPCGNCMLTDDSSKTDVAWTGLKYLRDCLKFAQHSKPLCVVQVRGMGTSSGWYQVGGWCIRHLNIPGMCYLEGVLLCVGWPGGFMLCVAVLKFGFVPGLSFLACVLHSVCCRCGIWFVELGGCVRVNAVGS